MAKLWRMARQFRKCDRRGKKTKSGIPACKLVHYTEMLSRASILGQRSAQRALAVVTCVVLLCFAVGTFVHEHKSGPETACSVCQALHMPAIAGAPSALIAESQPVAWQDGLSPRTTPTDSFRLHRASRAPPA